jgi:Big-like domain-containing protein
VDAADTTCSNFPVPFGTRQGTFDQRGQPRPLGPACDIGAFELEALPASAQDDTYSTDENAPLTVATPGVLSNDHSYVPSGVSALVVAEPRPASSPSHGTLQLDANGSFTYTPQTGFTGTDSFTYWASHGGLLTSDPATVTITVTPKATPPVSYTFEGFFPPVDNPPTTNAVKAGRSIPVKFSLGGDQGLEIFAPGYPKSGTIPANPNASVDPIETVSAGASGLSYDAASDQYTYVWKTDKAWSGQTPELVLKLTDGSEHKANFKFN